MLLILMWHKLIHELEHKSKIRAIICTPKEMLNKSYSRHNVEAGHFISKTTNFELSASLKPEVLHN